MQHAVVSTRKSVLVLALVCAALCLMDVSRVHAQSFSATDLEGTWEVFQLATPKATVSGSGIVTYRGEVTFDASGVVTGVNVLADNQSRSYLLSGNLSVSTAGVVGGTLTLTNTDPGSTSGSLTVREARLLASRHTIIGAANVLGLVGLVTFAKRQDGQTFDVSDIGGLDTADWSYHELTPSNAGTGADADAAWVNGLITFHGTNANPGCSEADLVLSDGTVRSQTRNTGVFSFG
jgi:hypothetical protein